LISNAAQIATKDALLLQLQAAFSQNLSAAKHMKDKALLQAWILSTASKKDTMPPTIGANAASAL